MSVSVDENPTLTIVNQTGHPVVVTAPVSRNINNDARTQTQAGERSLSAGSIDVTYRIGQIEFTEQVVMNNADATVILTRRPPTVTVINQTGRPINLTTPSTASIPNGARTQFLPPVLNQRIDVTYSIGQMQFTEQVTVSNADATVTLTRSPPTITIMNNTGAGNNVNVIQFRTPGSAQWLGGNIIIVNNELRLAEGTAQAGVTTQVLTNGERLSLWFGNLPLSGNAFDIRLQTVGGTFFQRDNVRITGDTTITFTAADRR
jgi:hypothetical protein